MGESRLLDLLGHGPTSQQIKVTRHRDSTPIFKANHIEPQLEDLISRDINLPSGGSIRIDHTEALTVFDVNSAHYTGKSNKLEDLSLIHIFGLHLFPYIVVVYLLSLVKSSVYEERWYWSCGIIGVCTILDGIMRCIMIGASGGDIQFISYMGHMVMPTVFWNEMCIRDRV